MRIVWSDDAIESVDNTADYIEDNFGVNRSMEFYDEVQEQVDSLLQFPPVKVRQMKISREASMSIEVWVLET